MPTPGVRRSRPADQPRGLLRAVVATVALLSILVLGMPAAEAGPAATESLTVTLGGNGTGTVTSTPTGIDCPSTCTFDFDTTDTVSLAAAADPSSDFDHWTGDCTGSGACDVLMDVARAVTAVFILKTRTLDVATAGNGSGTVTSTPGGINCGSNCSQGYDDGTDVSLAADPDPGSVFDHWTGDCTGTGACDLTMNGARTVTAFFTLTVHTLQVVKNGNGTGTVTGSPGAIDCGADCSHNYNDGTEVTLTAGPNASSVFDGWSGGGCSGTGDCVVTMSADRTVTATFTLKIRSLQVDKDGNGGGSVSGSPGNIDCGATCSHNYNSGTEVTLTAVPNANSVFAGWAGDCSGTGDCVVTMNVDRAVTATFTLRLRALQVVKDGNGAGTVTSTPSGIDCGATCSHSYSQGTHVSLAADAGVSSVFTGWTGDCSGTGSCDVTMNGAADVTATFTLRRLVLTVRKGGNGKGIVTSAPAGINCRVPCNELSNDFNYGTSVTLHAFPGLGARFIGWRGACSGRGACVVPMTARRQVLAIFSTVCGRIAFVSTRAGNDDIFTMNADGTRVINVTQSPAADSEPAWAPDCSRIAFVSDRNGNPDIYVMNTDGTGVRRVTFSTADDTQPTWAPGGNRIAFTRTIALNGDLFVIAPDGTHGRRLTSGAADDFRPDWSPNGLRIAFVSTRGGGSEQIFTMSSAGGRVVQVTRSRGQNLQPAWAPSGRRIAFVSTRDGNRELYIANANGSGAFRMTHNPGIDAHPSWSPGGAKIAFYSTRAGDDEVFAINANATHAINLSRNPASDTAPVWSS